MDWTEHRSPDGQAYWYSPSTNQSVWTKPDALRTPAERAIAASDWDEYVGNPRRH